ncbi:ABC transporter ATP-binding protein/permease [Corynebacterium sp. ES2730-CONJ]|uniref:amino acid ABC transporter ATP-binding/permease protein n=1 Tax=Corynebacterium sp. ES2730-CONJ TaxID=2973941 RepID=UPI00216ACD62|nr:ABC transporter ATP-binding protein [Corynebacterium sp. ES2730-CONJ]MCS4532302.1 ABC transporter ATP-binding protein/permease [Corynebacterium sp. ES2730-CONJ]
MNEPTYKQLVSWLISITRPVLAPLGWSTICRILNQILGIVIFVVPAYAIVGGTMTIKTVMSILIISALAKAFLRYLEHYFGHLVAFKALELIRIRVFRDIYPQAPAITARTGKEAVGTGDMLNRLTRDIGQIEVFFAHTTAPIISALTVPTVVLIAITFISPWHGLATAAIFLCVGLIAADTRAYRHAVKVTAERGIIAQHIADSVGGVAEVVGYGARKRRHESLTELEKPLAEKIDRRGAVVGAHAGLVAAARMVVFLLLLIPTDNMALSVAIVFAVLRCWDMVNEVSDLGNYLSQSLAAARRVYSLSHAGLAHDNGPRHLAAKGPGIGVEWRDISFSYAGSRVGAVRSINLAIAPGSWSMVVGSTGSGKSTIAKLLLRYWDPSHGRVLVDGHDLRDYHVDDIRAAINFVTQDIKVLSGTVADNLRLAHPQALDTELKEVMSIACLSGEISLDQEVGQGGLALSGGQRQRLSLAQALLRGGRVLVLDEFTAHLNPSLVQQVRENLRRYRPDATIIEIAHDLDSVDSVDLVAVMDQGEIIEQGDPQSLQVAGGALSHLMSRNA